MGSVPFRLVFLFCFVFLILLSSCSIKAANVTFSDEVVDKSRESASVDALNMELELLGLFPTKEYYNRNLRTFDLIVGFTSVLEPPGSRFSSADLNLSDLYLTTRYFPFRYRFKKFLPYLGAGVGWYRYFVEFHEDVLSNCVIIGPETLLCEKDTETTAETISSGYFPLAMIGANMHLFGNYDLVFEFRHDFNKENTGIDFSNNTLLFGIRWKGF